MKSTSAVGPPAQKAELLSEARPSPARLPRRGNRFVQPDLERFDPLAPFPPTLIAQVLEAGFNVTTLARNHGLGLRQFERKFRLWHYRSPRAVIQEIRMALAFHRLAASVSCKQIAHELGYYDTAGFTHAFQAFFGESPSEFRARRPGKPPCHNLVSL